MSDFDFDDLPVLFDPNDEEAMADIAEICGMDNLAGGFPESESGMTRQEMAIEMFVWTHKQDQIVDAQAECIEYLWAGGWIQ